MTETISSQSVKPGMIIEIYGTDRVDVEKVLDKWGAIQVLDYYGKARGLNYNEPVKVLGYFNPEN